MPIELTPEEVAYLEADIEAPTKNPAMIRMTTKKMTMMMTLTWKS